MKKISKSILYMTLLFAFGHCASSPENNNQSSPSLVEQAIEKANSPTGQKVIQTVKEKAQDPATQGKLKSLLNKAKD